MEADTGLVAKALCSMSAQPGPQGNAHRKLKAQSLKQKVRKKKQVIKKNTIIK